MAIRATVRDGRLVVDEPTLLPEGTTLNLVVDDEGDDLDEEERAALDENLKEAARSLREDRTRPASELLAELWAKRGR